MSQKDLKAFGQKLQQLRKIKGLYQEELAEYLCQIHAKSNSVGDLKLDGNRISKWERAFINKDGREWRPNRRHMLCLIKAFATHLTPETAQTWAAQAGYQFSQTELRRLLAAEVEPLTIAIPPMPSVQMSFTEPGLLSRQTLFGVEDAWRQLRQLLDQTDAPWLIAIDGIGGIGKTSLACHIVRDIIKTDRFQGMAWVSAKQEEYLPGQGLRSINGPALDSATLVDALLEQLHNGYALPRSPEEKLVILSDLLAEASYLIVIDNLETIADYQSLLPLLRQLANPSKVLLTSRHSLHAYSDVYCFNLKELDENNALAFIRHQAKLRGASVLVRASKARLKKIYRVVGGNPLALELVVGQTCVLPLSQVLKNLKQAEDKTIDELYTYIYWQVWQTLDEAGQRALLVMPLTQGGPLDQLLALSELEIDVLNQALEHLAVLSLVEVSGDLEERQYRLHPLTETFLLKEVAKWQ
jgi:transcriptional regulator with XRE-family HTH domain